MAEPHVEQEWDWTSVYKTEQLFVEDNEDEKVEPEVKPPVSAACSHDHSAERAIYGILFVTV